MWFLEFFWAPAYALNRQSSLRFCGVLGDRVWACGAALSAAGRGGVEALRVRGEAVGLCTNTFWRGKRSSSALIRFELSHSGCGLSYRLGPP